MATRVVPCLALLLICLAVVTPWSSPKQKDGTSIPHSCSICKRIVTWVQRRLGKDTSKEKISQLLDRVCLSIKNRLLQKGCKFVLRRMKNKLINIITTRVCPLKACRELRLCKANYVMLQ